MATQAPDLADVVQHAVAAGYDHLLLDGTLIPTDRVHNTGASFDRWYSGKHKHHGGMAATCRCSATPTVGRSGSHPWSPALPTISPL